MRAGGFAVAACVGLVIGQACLVELDHEIACGDGYIDREAGEQCDPGEPAQSHLGACGDETGNPNGVATCDPESCTIDRSTCHLPCGNGKLEPELGEECEPAPTGGIAIERSCADLVSPYRENYPYTSGSAIDCLSDCKLDRRPCGYCGNGKTDGPTDIGVSELQLDALSRPEICDGEDKPLSALADAYPQCLDPEDPYKTANVDCAPDCSGFVERSDVHPCCLRTGAACPDDGEALRCCHEFKKPGEDPCYEYVVGEDTSGGDEIVRTCK